MNKKVKKLLIQILHFDFEVTVDISTCMDRLELGIIPSGSFRIRDSSKLKLKVLDSEMKSFQLSRYTHATYEDAIKGVLLEIDSNKTRIIGRFFPHWGIWIYIIVGSLLMLFFICQAILTGISKGELVLPLGVLFWLYAVMGYIIPAKRGLINSLKEHLEDKYHRHRLN